MRILHINKYFHDHDGAGRYMFDLMRLEEQAGHIVAPFAMNDPRNAPSAWDKYFVSNLDTSKVGFGLHGVRQAARALWSGEAKKKLEDMIKAFNPDIVHIHNIYTHLSPSILGVCRRHDLPVVMTVHDYALVSADYSLGARKIKDSWLATGVLGMIQRLHKLLRLYDKHISIYLASSKFVKQTLIAGGYRADKIKLLPLFASNLIEHDNRHPHPSTREGVLFAGRLETYKGVNMVIAAAEKFPEVNFYVAGTGPLENDLHTAASRHSNLTALGFMTGRDLWRKMAEVQLVLVPSLWPEPFGLVALEAMAVGTPVLVSDAGGLSEKVKEGETGLIFKANDQDDLDSKLKTALKNPQKLAKMGEAAQAYAMSKADPEAHVQAMLKIYEQTLSTGV